MPHHLHLHLLRPEAGSLSSLYTRTLHSASRRRPGRPDPAPQGACGGLWAQLAVYDMDGPVDAGKMPSLTPGESAPRSISTRLSSLSRALSPWSGSGGRGRGRDRGRGVGIGVGLGGSLLRLTRRTLGGPEVRARARAAPAGDSRSLCYGYGYGYGYGPACYGPACYGACRRLSSIWSLASSLRTRFSCRPRCSPSVSGAGASVPEGPNAAGSATLSRHQHTRHRCFSSGSRAARAPP